MNTERLSCAEAREKLPLYVGGDLDGTVLEAVRGHLEGCGECALRSAEATRARHELVVALRQREVDVAAPDLWPGIRSVLRAEGIVHVPAAQRVAARAARRTPRWTWAFVPAAAAALLLALVQLGGFSGGRGGAKREPVPALPEVVIAPPTMPVLVPKAPGIATVGLQNTDPSTPSYLPAPFRKARGDQPVPTGISLTGLKQLK